MWLLRCSAGGAATNRLGSCFRQLTPRLLRLETRSRKHETTVSHLFFSTSMSRSRRPYLHRQYRRNDSAKPEIWSFFDRISPDSVFWGIISINGIVFILWYMANQRLKLGGDPFLLRWMNDNLVNSWRNLSSGRIWTLIAPCFSHENISHILFNGFTFFFMARPVLSILGSRRFLSLYLGGGTLACISSMFWHNVVKHRDVDSLGASGAIYSVISFLACVAPRMTFTLYGIIPLPAWLAVLGVFTYDTYSAIYDQRMDTNTVGHITGLIAGIGYFLYCRKTFRYP